MILAGIDMGVETTKAVILEDGAIVGRSKVSTGGIDRPEQARRAYEAALADAGVEEMVVEGVSATGKGKYDVAFAGRRVTETIAAAHAARRLCPGATAVVSAGADETLAATLGAERPVGEYVLNQKCTAGLGTFLRTVAERLGLSLDALGEVETEGAPGLNENCAVFAELDALSLLNGGAAPETVASACVRAAAVRAAAARSSVARAATWASDYA